MNQHDPIWVELVDAPIQFDHWQDRLQHDDCGAQGWFLGVTRRTTGDTVTQTLWYEAHRPMALAELRKLAEQAAQEFELKRLVLIHRLGEVPIGQASVLVGCCSPHRPQTFAALAWIMDTLKREVPIWKRERYADGSSEWMHPHAEPTADE